MKRSILILTINLIGIIVTQAAEAVFDYERSKVEIEVKATGHDFTGTLTKYKAAATLNKNLTPTAGKITWDFKDLKTGNGSRDKKMLSWLSAALTQASFTFEKWNIDDAGNTSVDGTMEIHGVKQKMSFPMAISKTGDEITATGDVIVDYTKFKLPVISFMKFFKVDSKVRVKFNVKGTIK